MTITFNTQNPTEVEEVRGVLDMLSAFDKKETPSNKPVKPKEESTQPKTPKKEVKPSEAKPAPKKEVKPPKADTKDSSVTLDQLKTLAKEAVGRSDRETVKKCISRYGSKLAEVSENNYENLASELGKL